MSRGLINAPFMEFWAAGLVMIGRNREMVALRVNLVI